MVSIPRNKKPMIFLILDNNMHSSDEKYMQRCLELARKGIAHVKPNPMVGSVIVYQNKIIGESFHRQYGQPHAEVNAINSVIDQSLLSESTLYVNLEPCAHHGKTPPCSDLIIAKKIKRVVIGCQDSYAEVDGKGIQKMRKAGIEVIVGVLEKESRELNDAFFKFHKSKRPYLILKWAQTLDGFIDIARKIEDPIGINWITNPILKLPVHKWRSEEMAILVGAGTAINDNPRLDTREWYGKNPLRILFSETNQINTTLNLFDGSTPTLIFCDKAFINNAQNTQIIALDFSNNPIQQMLDYLYELEIQTVIVEGGQKMLQSFIDLNLWDEARVLIGAKNFKAGLSAPVISGMLKCRTTFGTDTILHYTNES